MVPRLKQLSVKLFFLAWSGLCLWAAISGLRSGTVIGPARGGHGDALRASEPDFFWYCEATWLVLACIPPLTFLLTTRPVLNALAKRYSSAQSRKPLEK